MKAKNIMVKALSLALCFAGSTGYAFAHGYIVSPASRAFLCKTTNTNCGSVQYEPQSLEGDKGFPQSGPRDGHIASADKSQFYELDEQSPIRWQKVPVSKDITFQWKLTAKHKTTQWRYFITRQAWDPSKPLTRSAFETQPFCIIKDNGAVPSETVTHTCTLPAGRSGYQVIMGVWDIFDTDRAFYQVMDVVVK